MTVSEVQASRLRCTEHDDDSKLTNHAHQEHKQQPNRTSHSIYALPEEGKTPQTPSGSSSPLAFPLSAICSLLTLLTSNPTVTGPIKVQSKIAQVTTRNSSEFPPSPNTPFASATELIRKPISPRETMALPKMAAG